MAPSSTGSPKMKESGTSVTNFLKSKIGIESADKNWIRRLRKIFGRKDKYKNPIVETSTVG